MSSDPTDPSYREIVAPIDFAQGPFASVTLVIELSTTCFPFEQWQDNPPPAGESWPADCDAFDRLFVWTLDDPAVELVRAITPFGGPMQLEIDITDVANGLPGERALRAFISTSADAAGQVSGSDGGWNVSAHIDVVPGPAPREILAVVPLYADEQEVAEGPTLPFEVPAEATGGRIEYRVTGHGGGSVATGCIGPAEEFCRREHTIFVDAIEIDRFEPWRDDCDSYCTLTHWGDPAGGFDYCLENPTGAVQSVRAPRANWCPGALTPPRVIDLSAVAVAGRHDLSWQIDQVAESGRWKVSATYFAWR